MPEFLVRVTITQPHDPREEKTHARMITAYSLDDATRRVVAAMKLVNEPKEGEDAQS